MKCLPTEKLIEKCIAKEESAWSEFVRRYTPLLSFAIKTAFIKYAGHKNFSGGYDIQNLLQKIFLNLWSGGKLKEIRDKKKINYWLAIVARNTVLDYIKHPQDIPIGAPAVFEKYTALFNPRIPEKLDAEEKIEKIYNLLTTKEKLVFRLYFLKRHKVKNVAEMLKIPLGSIVSILYRIKRKINAIK